MINVGVVGVGIMGEYHTRIYKELEKEKDSGIHLVGIADIDYDRAKSVADKYEIKEYANYMVMINDFDIDAVSICVPTSKHKQVALDILEHGRNRIKGLLIEKPISDNLNDALSIVNVARRMGVKLLIGHVERFNPIVFKMQELIKHGKLGQVVSISAKRVGPGPMRESYKDVGIIVDVAVHDIDIISYLFEEYPTDIYAIDGNLRGRDGVVLGKIGLEDRASIMMRYNDGRVGIIETNWLTPHKIRKLEVVGFEKVAYLDYIDQTIKICGKEMTEEIKLKKPHEGYGGYGYGYGYINEEPLKRELRHFINVINGKDNIFVTGEDGVQVLRVALAATESYKTGNVVKLGVMIGGGSGGLGGGLK